MNLYLVRHAEAADKAVDPRRNLTPAGWRAARALARQLRPMRLEVSAIWHSDKPRAIQTAQAVAAGISGGPSLLTRRDGLHPFDRAGPVARELRSAREDLMIVGHEPFLGRLAAKLVTGRASSPLLELDKPSIACLRRGVDNAWRVVWFISGASLVSGENEEDGAHIADAGDDLAPSHDPEPESASNGAEQLADEP